MRIERGGRWVEITWKQYSADVQRAARAFMHLGMKAHEVSDVAHTVSVRCLRSQHMHCTQ